MDRYEYTTEIHDEPVRFTAVAPAREQMTVNVWKEGVDLTPEGVSRDWVNFDCFTTFNPDRFDDADFAVICDAWLESIDEVDHRYGPGPHESRTLLYG